MKASLMMGIGALLVLTGVIWALQGLGYIAGSVMTGVTLWAVIGPIVALIGLAMSVIGVRRSRPARSRKMSGPGAGRSS